MVNSVKSVNDIVRNVDDIKLVEDMNDIFHAVGRQISVYRPSTRVLNKIVENNTVTYVLPFIDGIRNITLHNASNVKHAAIKLDNVIWQSDLDLESEQKIGYNTVVPILASYNRMEIILTFDNEVNDDLIISYDEVFFSYFGRGPIYVPEYDFIIGN